MIISTPIFEPSRMGRTFKEVYSAGTKTGYVEKAKTAANDSTSSSWEYLTQRGKRARKGDD